MGDIEDYVSQLDLKDLKRKWEAVWFLKPPPKIGQKMLRKSLCYKLKEQAGLGLSNEDQARLKRLVGDYQKNKIVRKTRSIKSGTRLIRVWKSKKHSVLVTENGFEYDGLEYGSLSKIAAVITGTKWNGLVFFGLKKRGQEPARS